MTIVAVSAGTAAVQFVIVPVVVATLTAAATLAVSRASEASNRRRDRYAQAVQTLVAWSELPYRVKRRTSDDPATIERLAGLAHDLQERLACHQAWIATDLPALADAYAAVRATISAAVGPALVDAWASPPVTTAAGMNLGAWGPAVECQAAVATLQHCIERRFGWRRFKAWVTRER